MVSIQHQQMERCSLEAYARQTDDTLQNRAKPTENDDPPQLPTDAPNLPPRRFRIERKHLGNTDLHLDALGAMHKDTDVHIASIHHTVETEYADAFLMILNPDTSSSTPRTGRMAG